MRSSMPDWSATMTFLPAGALSDMRRASEGLGESGLTRVSAWGLNSSPESRPVVSAPQYRSGMGSMPPTSDPAVRNFWMRVSKMVDLTSSRARAAAATTPFSCSCRSMNAWSVLARAGTVFSGLVGDGFIGTSTFKLSSRAAKRGALASSARTFSTASSSLAKVPRFNLADRSSKASCLRTFSSAAVLRSSGTSSSNAGSVRMRMVESICHSSCAV